MAGVAAAAAAIGTAELVAALTGPRSSPLVAVGGLVVDTAPEPVKRFGIEVFGTYDKIALLVGTALLLGGFAALIGMVAARRLMVGLAGIVVFGGVGAAAALTRAGADATDVLPSLVGAAVGGLALWAFVAGPLELDPGVADPTAPGWPPWRQGVSAAREAITLPAPVSPAPPVPAGADLAQPGLASYVTSNRNFYRIDTALVVPQVDPETWQLRIHGRVRNPVTLSYADLLARPMVERYVTLACVSNEVGGDLIGNARWLGVPIRELLDEVGPLDGADQVVGRSVDGWTCGTPTAVLRDGRDALLAVGMNGEPLPVQHGFPVRMVVPGLYGYVSACKWITELELTSFADFDAYWVPRGWSAQGPVKTQSRIDTPRPRNRPAAGPVTVAGVAWAQHRGIDRVEVRVDEGPWQQAQLAPTISVDTWVQWSWQWQATPGEHTLQVRATDSTGETQTGEPRDVAPDGATGWHSVTLTIT